MAEANAAPRGQLIDIGTVAANNIAVALGLPGSSVPTVRDAIRDEIRAMSEHFTLVVTDMTNQFEIQTHDFATKVAELKSGYRYAREHKFALLAWNAATVVVGFLLGKIL